MRVSRGATHEPDTVAAALRKRGATLNRAPEIRRLRPRPARPRPAASGFVAMVRSFDGFPEGDEPTLFTMWSIETILAGQRGFARSADYIAFGDYSIDANFILCDPRDAARPVLFSGGHELPRGYGRSGNA